MHGSGGDGDGGVHRETVVVAGVVVLVGLGVLGGLVYADATTEVSRADYEAYTADCDALAGQTRVVEDGLGMEPVTLDDSHVAACRNATFADYREQRLRSMRSTPLNRAQWAWYGGAGLGLVVGGGLVLRRQLP